MTNSNALPGEAASAARKMIAESRTRHIFRAMEGHLPDTSASRAILEHVANDPNAWVSNDQYGNAWYARVDANGDQVWAQVRGDCIINGGVNHRPRSADPHTGLAAPLKPSRQ